MANIKKSIERVFLIEQVFSSWEEYEAYYKEAGKVFNKGKRKRPILKNVIRRYFEVEFKPIKSPRYHYPEDSESIVLQVPNHGFKTRRTINEKRIKLLDEHQHVVGITEMYIKDQIAMRLKILGVKVQISKNLRNSRKKQLRKDEY